MRQWNDPCPKCGNTESLEGGNLPPISYDLLTKWAQNDSLQFSEQDEEIIIGANDRLDLLLKLLDYDKITEHKRGIIIQALCVLLYDNLMNKAYNPDADRKIADRIVEELNVRKTTLKLGKGQFIERYIAQVVFPVLGFEIADNF